MATGGGFDDDREKEFEEIRQQDCVREGGNTYVTNNSTRIGTFYNINKSKDFIINTLCGQASNEKPTQCFLGVICGKNIELSDDDTSAKRKSAAISDGVCFVKDTITDPVHFRITATFEGHDDIFLIGFSKKNPAEFHNAPLLQTGMESAKHSSGIVVVEPAMATSAYPGAIIYFKYENGHVYFGSSKDQCQTPYPVPSFAESEDLWAFIELQGPVSAVELINNDFHEVCGTNVAISGNTAYRCFSASYLGTRGGFTCFTKTPIKPGVAVEFKLTNISIYRSGHIRTGICTTSPVLIPQQNLPATLIRQEDYKVIEINAEYAVCGTIISLIPIENQILVSVNNKKRVGLIEVDDVPKWAVVELFGNTKAVQLIPHASCDSRITEIPSVASVSLAESDKMFLQVRHDLLALRLESEVLVNHLKAVAEAVQNHGDTHSFGAYWNSCVRTLTSLSTHIGLPETCIQFIQTAEVGDYPEIMRTQAPKIADSAQELSCTISQIKEDMAGLQGQPVSKHLEPQFDLLTEVVKKLHILQVRMPQKRTLAPESPPPSPCLLDLSLLPVDVDAEDQWYEPVVVKVLLDTANKVEAMFQPTEIMIRDVYALGI